MNSTAAQHDFHGVALHDMLLKTNGIGHRSAGINQWRLYLSRTKERTEVEPNLPKLAQRIKKNSTAHVVILRIFAYHSLVPRDYLDAEGSIPRESSVKLVTLVGYENH
jgi:hypothetical protein